MSSNHFLKLGFRAMLALTFFTSLPVMAQTSASTERVLERTELLPHLETIRRQYPRLYDRLRREVPTEQLQQAMEASAANATLSAATVDRKPQPAAAATQHNPTTSRTVSINALLRQEIRPRATSSSATKATAGSSR